MAEQFSDLVWDYYGGRPFRRGWSGAAIHPAPWLRAAALDGRSGRAGDPSGWQEDQEAGKDMEYFRAMYPEKMKRLQRSISDLCDTIDYEGSILYDEYPDRVGVRRLCGEIYRRELPEDAGEAEAEWMKAAIEVLFCHEICARRIRRRSWRKRYW